jgi:hypothetical protein
VGPSLGPSSKETPPRPMRTFWAQAPMVPSPQLDQASLTYGAGEAPDLTLAGCMVRMEWVM